MSHNTFGARSATQRSCEYDGSTRGVVPACPGLEGDGAGTALLTVAGLAKSYPGVRALRGVDLILRPGEIRALLGKNGAGKSTLVRILSGSERPDSGRILLEGREVRFAGPAEARADGIATVWQELSLVDGLSVAENITLGCWPQRRLAGVVPSIDHQRLHSIASLALEQLGTSISTSTLVDRLSLADRQIVEIAKAITANPKILILDEPTSSLPAREVEALLAVVRRLGTQAVTVIYVSHRMREIPLVADSLTVLRDGEAVGTRDAKTATVDEITELMVGAEGRLARRVVRPRRSTSQLDVALAAEQLDDGDRLQNVSFELRRGEILGIAGLLGAGRSEILRAIVGVHPLRSGSIRLNGREITSRSPGLMRRLGVGLMPEDRSLEGLVLDLGLDENVAMAAPSRISRHGVISPLRRRRLAQGSVDDLDVANAGIRVAAGTLSGGNQQKLVLGKWLNAKVDVLLMDEPDRGIDLHAKAQIQDLVRSLADNGMSIIVTSSELEDLLVLSDRIAVLNHGRITQTVDAQESSMSELLSMTMETDSAGASDELT